MSKKSKIRFKSEDNRLLKRGIIEMPDNPVTIFESEDHIVKKQKFLDDTILIIIAKKQDSIEMLGTNEGFGCAFVFTKKQVSIMLDSLKEEIPE